MRILVDADACPVKQEVVKVAQRYELETVIVSNGGLRPSRDPLIRHVTVGAGADAADDWIVQEAQAGDIVVTADIPLASRALEKSAYALGPTGKVFDDNTIGMALAMRDLKQRIRESTQSLTRNRTFSSTDRSTFLQSLDRLIAKANSTKSRKAQT